jgi:hypothetical protein
MRRNFSITRKYSILINIDMHVHAYTSPDDYRRTRLPDSKTIGT